jgi:hypothetical protein
MNCGMSKLKFTRDYKQLQSEKETQRSAKRSADKKISNHQRGDLIYGKPMGSI